MHNSDQLRIQIILLAAGESSRLGQPKQLLTIQGTSLLRRTAKICLASRVGPVAVVLGSQAETMQQELEGLPLQILQNPDWSSGLASSVRCGVQFVMKSDHPPQAVIFVLCDQVMLTPRIIQQLRDRFSSSDSELISSQYGSEYGPPTLVGQSYFEELLTLTGQHGAKNLLMKYPEKLVLIPFEGGEIDIDLPEHLQYLEGL